MGISLPHVERLGIKNGTFCMQGICSTPKLWFSFQNNTRLRKNTGLEFEESDFYLFPPDIAGSHLTLSAIRLSPNNLESLFGRQKVGKSTHISLNPVHCVEFRKCFSYVFSGILFIAVYLYRN